MRPIHLSMAGMPVEPLCRRGSGEQGTGKRAKRSHQPDATWRQDPG